MYCRCIPQKRRIFFCILIHRYRESPKHKSCSNISTSISGSLLIIMRSDIPILRLSQYRSCVAFAKHTAIHYLRAMSSGFFCRKFICRRCNSAYQALIQEVQHNEQMWVASHTLKKYTKTKKLPSAFLKHVSASCSLF